MKRRNAMFFMLVLAFSAFANTAQVLPKDLLQTTFAVTYDMASQRYEADGGKTNTDDFSSLNLGAAVRFGLMDGVNVELEWLPGANVGSWYESSDTLKRNGVYDLFLGTKLQLWGDRGLIGRSKKLRLAVTPGFVIPLPGPDYEKQWDNFLDGESYTTEDVDKHALGIGARLSFDYVFSGEFFVNLCSEYVHFFRTSKTSYLSPSTERDYEYGYSLAFEAEPRYAKKLSGGSVLKASLPLTFRMEPESTIDGTEQDDESYRLTLSPRIGVAFSGSSPLELELRYSAPLLGKNVEATRSVSLLTTLSLGL